MEIDTPGHTASIFHSHPDYVTCYEKSPWTTYANEPPAGQVRFDLPEVQNFFAGIFEGATSLLRSPFFGTGGDELNQNCMVRPELKSGAPLNVSSMRTLGSTPPSRPTTGHSRTPWTNSRG